MTILSFVYIFVAYIPIQYLYFSISYLLAWFSIYLKRGDMMNSLTERIKAIEEEEIRQALRESDWVKSKAARKLGITERMIGYKIKKYEIRKEGALKGTNG